MGKMTYNYTIIKKLIFSGRVFTALWVCYRVLRGKLLGGDFRNIYALAGSNVRNICSDQMHDYEINRFNSWSELNEHSRKELSDCCGGDLKDITKLFDDNGCLWIGRLRGKITNLGWSRLGNKVAIWFFPLSPRWAILSHFETLPEQRGKGLYPKLLSHIMNELGKQGVEGYIIDCADWNLPSGQGIEKLGFKLIGHGVHRWGKYLIYYQWSKPDFNLLDGHFK